MPLPSRPCKYCGSLTHWPFQCRQNPKTKKSIPKKGKRTLEYEEWRDTVAIPYLDRTTGRICQRCFGARCGNRQLDVDHKKNRGSNPQLKMDLNNIQYLGRYPCHAEKTDGM